VTVRRDEGWAEAHDGLRLYWQRWSKDAPEAVLLFVHGLGEHSGRYSHAAEWFAQQGYLCWAIDYRGHGRSPGPRVHVNRFDEFVEDVGVLRALARREFPALPAFLVGQSQGGLVALRSLLLEPDGLSGAILSSPLLGIHPASKPSAALVAAGRILSVLAPRVRLANGVDPAILSHDPAVVEAYRRDPLVSGRVSVCWYWSMLEAMADTHSRAASLERPVLVMVSGEDRLVDSAAAEAWARAAPAKRVELTRWDGFYHEALNEPEKQQVFRRMQSWLRDRRAAGAAGR
jgi:alpha-beta hydrolase superfamily lysophospholipase